MHVVCSCQVVETADVILEVLDARDPLGSRAQAVEAAVLSKASKKLVLVLNKVCPMMFPCGRGGAAVLGTAVIKLTVEQ